MVHAQINRALVQENQGLTGLCRYSRSVSLQTVSIVQPPPAPAPAILATRHAAHAVRLDAVVRGPRRQVGREHNLQGTRAAGSA